MNEPLAIWVIYNKPRDYPDGYIARKWLIDGKAKGEPSWTDETYQSEDIGELRDRFEGMGLYRIDRNPSDEPQVVECWL